jgi:hypothetical protein
MVCGMAVEISLLYKDRKARIKRTACPGNRMPGFKGRHVLYGCPLFIQSSEHA